MQIDFDPKSEWLESDGLGGFASGTVAGRRARRYHALLLFQTRLTQATNEVGTDVAQSIIGRTS